MPSSHLKRPKMKLPTKISPCPIFECSVEIRFDSNLPAEAVFGVIYSQFQNEYPKVEKLPILQLPEQIRMSDTNLKHQACYKLVNGNIALLIGPKMIGIGCFNEYVGWSEFSTIINTHIQKIVKTGVMSKITHYGIRYVNFFDTDIFDKIKLKINMGDFCFPLSEPYIKTILRHEKYIILLQLASNVSVIKDSKQQKGSIVDLNLSLPGSKFNVENISDIISESHVLEKTVFFSLLKEEYIDTLNPQY